MHILKIIITVFFILISGSNLKSQWVKISNTNIFLNNTASFCANGNSLFAFSSYKAIYKSTDEGNLWLVSLPSSSISFQHSASVNGKIFGAGIAESISYSTNDGLNWNTFDGFFATFRSLAGNGGNLYAGFYAEKGLWSSNSGISWDSLIGESIKIFTFSSESIFICTYLSNIYRSTNNGLSWELKERPGIFVNALTYHYPYLYAGLDYGSIAKSSNNGANWTYSNVFNRTITELLSVNEDLLAGTDSGIYISRDYSSSWMSINQGFDTLPRIESIIKSSNYLLIATRGKSIWRRPYTQITNINSSYENFENSFSLQNYPNPFNSSTSIDFNIKKSGPVNLTVYDLNGKKIKSLINGEMAVGRHRINWNSYNEPSGIYYCRIVSDNYMKTIKLILIK